MILIKDDYQGTVGSGETKYGEVFNVKESRRADNSFSIQPIFTGDGTLNIGYQLSNNGTAWSAIVSIVVGATTGEVTQFPADGVKMTAAYQRLVLTETGDSDDVVVANIWRCFI